MNELATSYEPLLGAHLDKAHSGCGYPRPRRSDAFLILLALTMATGSVVLFEPAPIDLALVAMLLTGLVLGKLRLDRIHIVPIVLLGCFALSNILSLWDPIQPVRALWYGAVTLYLIVSMVFFTALVSSQGKRAVDMILAGYIAAAILNIALAAGAYFNLIPGQHLLLLYGRPKGLFKDPNVYGPYVVPVATLALSCFLTKTLALRQRLWWGLLLAGSVAGIFLSFSRACWFNCAVSMVLLAGFTILQSENSRQLWRKLVLIAGIAAISGPLLYVMSNVPVVSSMLKVRLGNRGFQDYDRVRFHTHALAAQTVINRPLGIGPGQAELAFNYSTHSTYLRVLSENGMLGGISLFTLFALTLYRSIRIAFAATDPYWKPFFTVIAVSLIGQLLNCVVIDSLHWRHLWLLLGLAWTVPESQ